MASYCLPSGSLGMRWNEIAFPFWDDLTFEFRDDLTMPFWDDLIIPFRNDAWIIVIPAIVTL